MTNLFIFIIQIIKYFCNLKTFFNLFFQGNSCPSTANSSTSSISSSEDENDNNEASIRSRRPCGGGGISKSSRRGPAGKPGVPTGKPCRKISLPTGGARNGSPYYTMTCLERLIRAHPIWFLPKVNRDEANLLLAEKETGVNKYCFRKIDIVKRWERKYLFGRKTLLLSHQGPYHLLYSQHSINWLD
jgi:hypothetical protein